MKRIILFLAITVSIAAYGQNDSISNSFVSDFNTFTQYLEETHPDPYTVFGGKMNFRRTVQSVREDMEKVTDINDFRDILTAFMARLEDGHTFLFSGNTDNAQQSNKYFPIAFKIATDGLFIESTTKELSEHVGSKLLAINNISVEEVLQKAKAFQGVENEYGAMYNLCNQMSNQVSAEKLLGEFSIVELKLQNDKDGVYNLNVNYVDKPDRVSVKSKVEISGDNNLLYSAILKKENVAYLAWNSFTSREILEGIEPYTSNFNGNANWVYSAMQVKRPDDDIEAFNKMPELYKIFSSLLEQMKDRKTQYLIIDLRNNSGGMTPLCMPLLYMMYGDDYLNYYSDAQYNTLLSPLLLKTRYSMTIDDFNKKWNTDYRVGDYIFRNFFAYNEDQTIEEKRKDLSLITYNNGIGKQYTENLNGVPIYRPHVIILCSPQTFSAAYHFTYLLTQVGKATVVGVPSRQAGNAFMETIMFELPNTKVKGSISNSEQVMFPDDPEKGKILMPDFPMMWTDYKKYNFDKNAEILYCIDLINQGVIGSK
ncbi:MAG: hypothetical protein LBV72_00835 [Tannerella sp.]|jgi:hypothetical protein|nr:hypothetical protein [Tannerella sp.]